MSLILKTAPAAFRPLTLAEAKAHLRVDHSDEDVVIERMISDARSACEAYLQALIAEATYLYSMDGFPGEIVLPNGPVFSGGIVAITYVDDGGTTRTLDAGNYQASFGQVCRIRPAYGKTWPSTRPQMDAAVVEYKAGWSDMTLVPSAIRSAVAMMLGHLFENREAALGGELPAGVRAQLSPFIRYA